MEISLIHKWDNRWKLVTLTISIFSISYVKSPEALGASLIFSLVLLISSRITLRKTIKSIKPPVILLVFMSPFILFTPGQNILWQWNIFRIYHEGYRLLFTIGFKSISIFIIFTALMHSSNMTKMMQAMKVVGIPGKMISILISTYRYIFLYIEDMGKLFKAARLKGFNLRKGFSHMLTSADILMTLLIRSYEQSERVQAAMVLRGFSGDFHSIERFQTNWYDPLLSSIVLLCCTGIISMEFLC